MLVTVMALAHVLSNTKNEKILKAKEGLGETLDMAQGIAECIS